MGPVTRTILRMDYENEIPFSTYGINYDFDDILLPPTQEKVQSKKSVILSFTYGTKAIA